MPNSNSKINKAGRVLWLDSVQIVDVAAGRYHSAALSSTGTLYTWGLNDFGQLGRPGINDCSSGNQCFDGKPTPIPSTTPPSSSSSTSSSSDYLNIKTVSAGRYHTAGITTAGSLHFWGLSACDTSLAVAQDTVFTSVQSGYTHVLALDSDGNVWSCGTGYDGYANALSETPVAMGNVDPECTSSVRDHVLGRTPSPSSPPLLLHPIALPNSHPGPITFVAIAAGRSHSLALDAEGKLWSWGSRPDAMGRPVEQGMVLPDIAPHFDTVQNEQGVRYADVAAGEYHTVALTMDGRIMTAGENAGGVLGPNREPRTVAFLDTPSAFPGGIPVSVAAGYQSAIALVQGLPPAIARSVEPLGSPPYEHSMDWDTVAPEVKAIDPHTFEVLDSQAPKGYLSEYKNPCFPLEGGELGCLPYFQILGVSKCGTTNMFHQMMGHPELLPASNKGPHWFDERRPSGTMRDIGPFEAYLELFKDVGPAVEGDSVVVAGEASSNTFTYSGVGVRGNTETLVRLPVFLHALLPRQKLIVVFREPVARFISAYYYYNHKDPSEAGLVANVASVAKAWEACTGSSADYDVADRCTRELYLHGAQQLVKGMYASYVRDWVSVYPPTSFLWLRLEDYRADPRSSLTRIFAHIGVSHPTPEVWDVLLAAPTRNKRRPNAPKTTVETLDQAARDTLVSIYRPFNARLGELLGPRFDYNVMYDV